MVTILDTSGIAVCSVSYGKESSFAGTLASVAIEITPMALGISQLRLVWAATGDIFSSFVDRTSGASGTPGIIVLPQTGQTGFRHGTSTFKDWYYLAIVTATLSDGQTLSRTYRFQIPAGTTTLDLDMLDEDGIVTAMPAVAPILPQVALSRTAVKTAAYTAGPNELVPVDSTGATVPVTLPSAPADKTRVSVKLILSASTVNPVTLTAGGTDVFNRSAGPTALTLSLLNQAVTVQYDAASGIWTVLSDDLPLNQLDARFGGSASGIANWAANTVYTTTVKLFNPSGDIVQPNVAHTSGATYDATKYAVLVYGAATSTATYVQLRSTPPDHTVVQAYVDVSAVPPTLKGWNGTTWVALGGAGTGGGTTYTPLGLDTDGVPYFVTGAYAALDTDGVPNFTASPDSTSKAVLTDTDGVYYLAA